MKDGPLSYDFGKMEYTREPCKKVALKCLNNSQDLTDEFFNEIKKYSTNIYSRYILKTYGLSQNPYTNDYIMVLEYAEGGNFNDWVNKNYENFYWLRRLNILQNIINGLEEIHQKGLVHRDLHTGNILLMTSNFATRKQPFVNRAHDKLLALDIVNKGIRPEIDEPNAIEIDKLISSFRNNFIVGKGEQFKESKGSIENNQPVTHSQAIYTSRLLNPFTKDLNSECLDCAIID
ncbi:kinase-like domain-containing protein [Rhizophagus clarus]|uniref:Kinase-like domain-containing protein n=1 Tax=Rhizophagus clarus TaxID=94130 RepID=A0A8H3LCL7_9GLOM|nr:kinase-like domain-containing protein [Rhizophagus clarus]